MVMKSRAYSNEEGGVPIDAIKSLLILARYLSLRTTSTALGFAREHCWLLMRAREAPRSKPATVRHDVVLRGSDDANSLRICTVSQCRNGHSRYKDTNHKMGLSGL